jgi:hypothetical protein
MVSPFLSFPLSPFISHDLEDTQHCLGQAVSKQRQPWIWGGQTTQTPFLLWPWLWLYSTVHYPLLHAAISGSASLFVPLLWASGQTETSWQKGFGRRKLLTLWHLGSRETEEGAGNKIHPQRHTPSDLSPTSPHFLMFLPPPNIAIKLQNHQWTDVFMKSEHS